MLHVLGGQLQDAHHDLRETALLLSFSNPAPGLKGRKPNVAGQDFLSCVGLGTDGLKFVGRSLHGKRLAVLDDGTPACYGIRLPFVVLLVESSFTKVRKAFEKLLILAWDNCILLEV